jgi:hypothetical protein
MSWLQTIKLTDEQKTLIGAYARVHGQSIPDAIRTAALEHIEDERDRQELEDAVASSDDELIAFEEVKARYDLR